MHMESPISCHRPSRLSLKHLFLFGWAPYHDTVGHNRPLNLSDAVINIHILFFSHYTIVPVFLIWGWLIYFSTIRLQFQGFLLNVYKMIILQFIYFYIVYPLHSLSRCILNAYKKIILQFVYFVSFIFCILCPGLHIVALVQSPFHWCDVGQIVQGLSAVHVDFFGKTGLVSSQVLLLKVSSSC